MSEYIDPMKDCPVCGGSLTTYEGNRYKWRWSREYADRHLNFHQLEALAIKLTKVELRETILNNDGSKLEEADDVQN